MGALPSFLRQLLPGVCLLCDSPLPATAELDVCRYCLAALPWNDDACPRCALPLAPQHPWTDGEAEPCADCTAHPPPFVRALAPLRYEGFARQWVLRLKDRLGMVEGRTLGILLARAAEARYALPGRAGRPDLIVPVPLTLARLARRGHNQAVTLAIPLAHRLGVPIARRGALRLRSGHRQRGLPRRQRLANPSGLFASRLRWAYHGPRVAIVDDVMTTGATAAELARALLDAGAREVEVLCATRTPLPPGQVPN